MAVIYTDVVQCLIMLIGAVVLAIISKRGGEGKVDGGATSFLLLFCFRHIATTTTIYGSKRMIRLYLITSVDLDTRTFSKYI